MPAYERISKMELARQTQRVVDRMRQGHTVIVEGHGEEQVVIIDLVDHRLLQAAASALSRVGAELATGAPAGFELGGDPVSR